MNFACSGCGLCCRNVGEVIEIAKSYEGDDPSINEIKKFPYEAKEDGSCEMLGEDGKCKVYETRPDICSVETMYSKHHAKETSKKRYFLKNAEICNSMIKENGLDSKYLIDTKQYK